MAAILAAHYGETETRLALDPIVIAMARDIAQAPNRAEVIARFTHSDGSPNHSFMGMANDRYRDQGGTDGGHIGAVANTILKLVQAG